MKLPWRRGPDRPVPGVDDTGLVGVAKLRLPPSSPPAPPPPGPLPIRHRNGGVTYTIRTWNCGCIHQWDGHGALIAVYSCTAGDGISLDWARLERELRDL